MQISAMTKKRKKLSAFLRLAMKTELIIIYKIVKNYTKTSEVYNIFFSSKECR